MKHINNYNTDVNYYNKKSFNKIIIITSIMVIVISKELST